MKYYFLLSLTILTSSAFSQAHIDINNNSSRTMSVKVMQYYGSGSSIYKTISVSPYGQETVYFSVSGTYFTKTKAVYSGKNPIYRKGKKFEVVNDRTGYSVLTLTFSIKESTVPEVTGGSQISKEEFDKN